MPTPLDLRAFAAALPEQDLSPRSLKTSVCNNITAAVAALAKASPSMNYAIDPTLLERVVGEYLEAHPNHNNPFNLLATEEAGWCHVDYYDLSYRIEENYQGKYEFIPQLGRRGLVDGKYCLYHPYFCEEGKWQYIEQLKGMVLVDGKRTAKYRGIDSGTFAYVPGASALTVLINGTRRYSNGRSETGKFAYIPQLESMKLVNGTTRNAEGEVVKQGRREYVPQKNGMVLIEGLSIFPDGTRQEGTRKYIPELNEVVLTTGSITRGNNVQTGTWVYSRYEGRMVFAPTPPKTKLPLYVRNQIQGVVQELVGIQHQFDSTGKYNTSAAMLNTAAEQATLAQNPEQYNAALQSFGAQYKTLTRELCLLTHPDKVGNYSASVHGVTFQQLGDLREAIDAKVSRWRLATVDWL